MQRQAIRYGDENIDFDLVVDPRRKDDIRITVDPMKGVRVSVPTSSNATDVRAAVRRRLRWIARQLDQGRVNQARSRFISGEQVLYLGRCYVLKVITARAPSVKLRGGFLRVELPDRKPRCVSQALEGWYRNRAAQYFRQRLRELYSPSLDGATQPPSFRLQSMARRWGSCSPSGTLLLNPALIRAPRECVDYVLVHELCHLRQAGHGRAFKKLLRRRMPDWETRKAALEGIAGEVLG
jgi:predicted metal-dependent hydrolase